MLRYAAGWLTATHSALLCCVLQIYLDRLAQLARLIIENQDFIFTCYHSVPAIAACERARHCAIRQSNLIRQLGPKRL